MRLYVGNLSFDTSEDELRSTFEQFGAVTDVKIMLDRDTSRSRGFGFVTMAGPSEGEAAINGLNGKNLSGRNLIVNEARPREDRPQGGGGGNGGGGRRPKDGGKRFSGSRRF